MSCTVIAVPYALAWIVGTVVTSVATQVNNKKRVQYANQDIVNLIANSDANCDGDIVITEKHFIEKTFETPFVDTNILLKTLEEHGVINIVEFDNGLSGEVDNYKLHFEKTEESKPYNLRISCLEKDNAEEKVGDLSTEYTMNVQEDAYLHIIDKLKENNMDIESEEVLDDNTIVLTVNIE